MISQFCYFLLSGFFLLACNTGPKKPLKAVHPARTRVESTITTISSGTVEAEQQAVLGFTTPGRVAQILVHVGDRVDRGQLLARLENTDLLAVYQTLKGT